MKWLFEGLENYEALLLLLGMVMFLVMLGLLIYMVVKERAITTLMGFFMLPIVMMGFPGIQSVKFGDNTNRS